MSSWHLPAISVLAGVGAGYLVGILAGKWLWRRRTRVPPTGQSYDQLVAVLSDLTTEVRNLQRAVLGVSNRPGTRSSRPSRRPGSETDFVSAQGSDDEFFDWNEAEDDGEREITSSTVNLDELGKTTLESEEACHSLIGEVNRQLEGSPDDPQLLWRLSRGLVHLSMHCEQRGEQEEERQLLVRAAEHAQRALELDDTVWQSHQWYAIAMGAQAKHEGTQKKIAAGHEYKEHIDVAISLNPNDPALFHLRGRWSYEVSCLSWLERKAASTLFATPPSSTFAEALEDFIMVETLNGGRWKANMMYVAKCYIELGDISTAKDWIDRSFELKVLTPEDKTAQRELKDLMVTCDTKLQDFS